MSDDELQFWALSGMEGSYVHEIRQTAMSMRCSLRTAEAAARQAEAAAQQTAAARELVASTKALAGFTRMLVRATWALFFVGGVSGLLAILQVLIVLGVIHR